MEFDADSCDKLVCRIGELGQEENVVCWVQDICIHIKTGFPQKR